MSNNCSISVVAEVAAVKTVVDAIRAIDVAGLSGEHAAIGVIADAIKVVSDAYELRRPASGTLDIQENMKNKMVTASDDLLQSNDAEEHDHGMAWTKHKEIIVLQSGIYRISFDLKRDVADGNGYGRIYLNDNPYGISRSTGLTTYQTYSEDLVITLGDNIQLYISSASSGYEAYVRNFRLYGVLNGVWFLNTM